MPRTIGLVLVLVAVVVGSLVGANNYFVSRAEAASSPDERFAYFCFEAATVRDINAKANAAGLQGWEMVTAAPGAESTIWCFRRRKQ